MLYQPRIKDDNIRRLYRLGKRKGQKMTKLINLILEEYLNNEGQD